MGAAVGLLAKLPKSGGWGHVGWGRGRMLLASGRGEGEDVIKKGATKGKSNFIKIIIKIKIVCRNMNKQREKL